MATDVLARVVLDPNVMQGQPIIRGTRIPVKLLVRMVAQGIPQNEILSEYPRLQPENIRAAIEYAGINPQGLVDYSAARPSFTGKGAPNVSPLA